VQTLRDFALCIRLNENVRFVETDVFSSVQVDVDNLNYKKTQGETERSPLTAIKKPIKKNQFIIDTIMY
jgi:hypothetical protein